MNESQKPVPQPSSLYRWSVLFFISMAMFGNYYVFDSISPLADMLKSQLNFSDSNIGLLNAIYSFPNIIMVLIGGLIIDRIGARKASLLFAMLCLVGSVVTALKGNVTVMAAGRLIFGLGAESLIVAITTVIARWFKGKELSLAFGLNLTLSRLGTFTALNSPTLAKSLYTTWQYPLLLSIGAAVLSVISVVVYFTMESHAEKHFQLGERETVDKVKVSDIFKLNPAFWYVSLLCVTFYSAIFPFQTFAVKFFQEYNGLTREVAGFTSSIITFASMVCTPLFGLMIDKVGKRATLMMIGSVVLVPVYLLLVYTSLHPLIPMVLMGLSFSLIPAAMWPSVALIVKENRLGTAYGVMTMIQNVGLFGLNLLIGWANDFSGGYTLGMWLFSTLGFAGMVFAWLLKRSDAKHNDSRLEVMTMAHE